ncbi:uroporphyrinogen-III synthase [Ruegeria sp. ANG-R]|uniref:uroporphyrinogen-III synthase n=1 Tax=Ruegeria sp. ANG-R TaxID=1577903 RepID=UPI000580B03C|nr:uroporphyrinogen-III synthase [Ruegeria sp. ANG-R]KIC38761.1 uroporphyrinogen-III synthase [Ruegeria sp. ANG-R]
MTRPRAASDRFVAHLPDRIRSEVEVIHSPLLEIKPLAVPVKTDGIAGLIFSSANGVNAAAILNVDRDLPAYCVGPATTDAARGAGWQAQMLGLTAEELVADLLKRAPESPLLHLRGEHSRGNVAEHLTNSGLTTREQPIYRQQLLPLTDEASLAAERDRPVIAPLFSPRTARQFADVWAGTAPLWLAAISEATAEPLKNLPFERLKIAREPTPDKMRKTVKKLVKHVMRVESAPGAD